LEAASQDTHHFQLLKDMGVLTFSDLFERHGCPDLFLLTFFVGVLTFSDTHHFQLLKDMGVLTFSDLFC
jgi:hypothetical protein